MKHYEIEGRFLKRFEVVANRLKEENPIYKDIRFSYMARKNCILVTIHHRNEDLLKTYSDDLCKIPEMCEILGIV